MSYNGYNYSPYYQSNTNDGRGPDSYQNSASTTGRYQNSSYSSPNNQSVRQPQQQQQSSHTPTTTSADRSAASYSSYGDSSGTNQYQNLRGGYGYPAPPPVETSALGNLAHASSLEQDSRNGAGTKENGSLQHIIDYNRTQFRHRNSASPLYGAANSNVSYSHQRSDSAGAACSGVPYGRDSVTSDRSASASSQQPQYVTTAGSSNQTVAYASTQGYPESISASYSSYQPTSHEQRQSTHYTQPARPASGQSYHVRGSDSLLNQQATQAPMYSTTQASTAPASYVSSQNAHSTYWQEPSTPSQQRQHGDRGSAGSPAQISGRTSLPAPSTTATTQRAHLLATGVVNNQESSRTPVPTEEQAPRTVDPSHVFNHQEYQRRQAEAAAAAAKKAAETQRAREAAEVEEENRKATEATAALKRVSDNHSNGAASSETNREEQMAAEMRQMIEKMREYKSTDPSLFSSIWEQVKKTQPAGSVPAAPPLSAKDIPSTAAQPNRANGLFSPSSAPSSGVEGEMPDLGKFPAQRRRRGGKTDSPARIRKSKGNSKTTDSPPIHGSWSSPPIDPAIIEASNHSQRQGMQALQGAVPEALATPQSAGQDRQVIYVSGAGPRAPQNPPPSISLSGPAPTPAVVQTPTAPGKTAWPEHKKWDLAVAAKSILLAIPVNSAKAKNISPEQILSYLNKNPSYEELCRMIESKGLIIERGHFARCLLEAVPGMGGGMQQRPVLANRRPAASLDTTQNGAGLARSAPPSSLQYLNSKQFTIPTPPKNVRTSIAPTAQMTPAASQPSTTPQMPATEEKLAVPLTKQEQARKRNILDIVDLSQLSDDEMLPPPPPKVHGQDEQSEVQRPPALNGIPTPTSTLQTLGRRPTTYSTPAGNSQYSYSPLPANPRYPYTPLPPLPPPRSAAPSQLALARQRELVTREDIVQPIDDIKARKRKGYNPKTIVRDVLIAAGRHPTMQPLNYHLDSLRKTFKHVNDMSDLSTFRWDLVDPGEPRPAPLVSGIRESRPQTELGGDNIDGNNADNEDQEVVTQSAPRVAIISARAGPSAAVNTAAAIPRSTQPPKLLGPQRKRPPHLNNPDRSWMSAGLNSIGSLKPSEPAPKTPQSVSNKTSTPDTEESTIKRRGRPPGEKNKYPRRDKETPTQSIPSRPSTTPARPSGLRNSVAGDGVAVLIPSPSPSIADTQPKRRGRPRKSSPKMTGKTSQQSSPIHRVYKCLWEDCPAELHNLETLRKHVNKHGDIFKVDGGSFPCLWKGCGNATRNQVDEEDDEEPVRRPLKFGAHEIWAKHMDKRHVAEYAWKLGDGPSTRSDSDMSDYVSDSAKRQVTPIITNEGRPDPLPLSANKETAKAYHQAHGNTSELDKAKAFMEAAERRRQNFGPGMDRTGATFVTKEMNALLDDSMGPLRKVPKNN